MSQASPDESLHQLKSAIAETWAERERLKTNLNAGCVPPHTGLQELEEIDKKLSDLDIRFKRLWDSR